VSICIPTSLRHSARPNHRAFYGRARSRRDRRATDAAQPEIVAKLREQGVDDTAMPEVLAEVHHRYWEERCRLLERYRAALMRVREVAG